MNELMLQRSGSSVIGIKDRSRMKNRLFVIAALGALVCVAACALGGAPKPGPAPGQKGWGQKGKLDLARIQALTEHD